MTSRADSIDMEKATLLILETIRLNAADLVSALERSHTTEAFNAQRILCLFEANAVPHMLAELGMVGPNACKEGLKILWALLVGEEVWTVRETMAAVKRDLDIILEDPHPLPDKMPDYIERDFRGRICDLTFIVIQQLIYPEYDQSLFRSLDESGRNDEIRRLKARGLGQNTV